MKGIMLKIACMVLFFSGCTTIIPPQPGKDPSFAPTYPKDIYMGKYSKNGAIYAPQTAISLFETPRAKHVGDVLTVLLVEQTNAIHRANSKGKKDDTTTINNPTVLGRPAKIGGGTLGSLAFITDSEREFTGEAESNQNNQLNGSISVTVARVLNNGNLIVQGEKWVKINQGNEYIRLSGIVRQQDITPENTITSTQVANARIYYSGTGQTSDANNMGLLSKILWSGLFPL